MPLGPQYGWGRHDPGWVLRHPAPRRRSRTALGAAVLPYVETVTGPDGQPYDRVRADRKTEILQALAQYSLRRRSDDVNTAETVMDLSRAPTDVGPQLTEELLVEARLARGVGVVGDVLSAAEVKVVMTRSLATLRQLGGYVLVEPDGGWLPSSSSGPIPRAGAGLSLNAMLAIGGVAVAGLAAYAVWRSRR